MTQRVNAWLSALGYQAAGGALITEPGQIGRRPYAPELHDLLRRDGDFQLDAVFSVENTPTVCFVDGSDMQQEHISGLRQRLWNQNLASALLVASADDLQAFSVPKRGAPTADFDDRQTMNRSQARRDGPWSAIEIQSSQIQRRLSDWFDPSKRVDRDLLRQLSKAVTALSGGERSILVDRIDAQMLLAQVLFICFLEHRGVVGDDYRKEYRIGKIHELADVGNGAGIDNLISCLKRDFNGDFLEPGRTAWADLPKRAIMVVRDFLSRVDVETGQRDFWNYDFSQIPVEMLSGIYETFLQEERKVDGAYYTPRVLAELAVEEAFRGQADITNLTVFDGACGSGILLTTAYRKIVYEKERVSNRRLDLSARISLLKATIFGSDVNEMACRVTAFSLYLCLLERIVPADIMELQGNAECKLPKLIGKTIAAGSDFGDFFSKDNPFASSKKFDVVISNPPWRELKAHEHSSALAWAEPKQVRLPHRQIAAAFAAKATEAAKFGGRIVLILPTSLITAPTNADFLRQFTVRATIERIINLADFRRILFANAEHACTIVHARNIPGLQDGRIEGTFEYWAPKADISFALNRLTLHEYDMMKVRRASLVADNDVLRRRFWGGERDEHLILRLRQLSSLRKFLADRPRWVVAKGYHKVDGRKSAGASDIEALTSFRYLPTNSLNSSAIVVDTSRLKALPVEDGVANIGDLRLYEGPRVLWPDGTAKDLEIRAAYTEERFAFSSSTGCLVSPVEDRDLARFLTCYLRSSLAKYWLVITGYSAASERARVTVAEIKSLPFMPPEQHPDPRTAAALVKQASNLIVDAQKSGGDLFSRVDDTVLRHTIDEAIFSYFGISEAEQMLVMDLVQLGSRSLQPTSYEKLLTPIQDIVSASGQRLYLRELEKALRAWSKGRGGEGSVSALLVNSGGNKSPLDVVHIELSSSLRKAHRPSPHNAVRDELLSALSARLADGRPIDFFSMPNSIFVWGDDLYITKPRRARFWTGGAALRDADEVFNMLSRPADFAEWGKS